MNRIDEIKARCEAATPGPWKHAIDVGKKYYIAPPSYGVRDFCYLSGGFDREHDAAFIANARDDIPFLLAELDRLTEAVAKIEKLCLKGPSYGISAGKFAVEIARVIDELRIIPSATKWISVTEDIPPYGDEVLVMHSGVVDIAVMDEVNVFTSLFTHWMPLPAAPEKGADE